VHHLDRSDWRGERLFIVERNLAARAQRRQKHL